MPTYHVLLQCFVGLLADDAVSNLIVCSLLWFRFLDEAESQPQKTFMITRQQMKVTMTPHLNDATELESSPNASQIIMVPTAMKYLITCCSLLSIVGQKSNSAVGGGEEGCNGGGGGGGELMHLI